MAGAFIFGKLGLTGLTIGVAARMLAPQADAPQAFAETAPSAAKEQTSAAKVPVSRVIGGLPAKWPLTGGTTPPATPTPTPPPAPATLPPLDLSTTWLWNWGGKWVVAQWTNADSPIPWKYDRVRQVAGGDTLFALDAAGAAQMQAGGATPAYTDGLWETDVTLPQLRDGLIVLPLWLYDPASRDEVDFEFVGRKGLDVTMHSYVNGRHIANTARLFNGVDMSGQRKRFGIKVDQKTGVVDMLIDGVRVHRWERRTISGFITKPMKPWMQLWALNPSNAGFVSWAGKWTPLAPGQTLTMRVHGYGYTALAEAQAIEGGKTGTAALP